MIRILIIDDEPPARARLKRLLDAMPDCEIAGEAGSGTRALELIPELNPELLLLDISMPGIDGMALARTLQAMDAALNLCPVRLVMAQDLPPPHPSERKCCVYACYQSISVPRPLAFAES